MTLQTTFLLLVTLKTCIHCFGHKNNENKPKTVLKQKHNDASSKTTLQQSGIKKKLMPCKMKTKPLRNVNLENVKCHPMRISQLQPQSCG